MVFRPIYSAFAKIYDETMAQVPYSNWAKVIVEIFHNYNIDENCRILDIACGTAKLTQLLKTFFPKIYGLDISYPMLEVAQRRKILNVLQAQMCELPFSNNSFQAAISTHDSLNYLPSEEKLLAHLVEVHRILKRQGLYLFDLSSEENVTHHFHKKVFHEFHGKTELLWYNEYDRQNKVIHSYLCIRNGKNQFLENHCQYIFPVSVVRKVIKKAKFAIVQEFTDYFEPKSKVSRLICFLLQKV